MIPTSFAESNAVLSPPPGVSLDECEALSVWRGPEAHGQPVIVSCWKMTAEERAEFLRTGRVYLILWGETMPPASMSAITPFMAPADEKQDG